MRLVWTVDALLSLKVVRRYIDRENPIAALAVVDRIESSIEQLSEFPRSSRPELES